MFFQLLVFIILNFTICFAEFNTHFADFVEENYGKTFLDALQRTELGDDGSFGGKNEDNEEVDKDPVIFIHGVSDIAGGKMQSLAAKFRKRGYKPGELYATTYADGNKNNPLAWAEYSMKCEHVKQIRTMILAVRYYTLRDVDIIAYSLGVPIARKAILGGSCVDTKEDLGSPLTAYIDTFVGIAGPNHGIALQIAGISIPGCVLGAIPILPICSRVIGLYSGFCPMESHFLTDINQEDHYEGKHVYSIYSKIDNWIGYEVCGQITAKIPGEDSHKAFSKYNHDEIIEKTFSLQIQMIEKHNIDDGDDEEQHQTSKNSSIVNRRRVAARESKESRSSRRSRTKHRHSLLQEDSSSSKGDSIKGKTKKRDVEDFDYLSDKYDHPTLPPQYFNTTKTNAISVAGKFSDFTKNRSAGQNNVVSKREQAEGSFGSWQHVQRRGPPAYDPDLVQTSTTQIYQKSWESRIRSNSYVATTTSASTTVGYKPPITTRASNYLSNLYTNTENEETVEGYHTHIKIEFD